MKAKRTLTIGTSMHVKAKSNRARFSGILRYMAEHPDLDVNLVNIASPYQGVRTAVCRPEDFDGLIWVPAHFPPAQLKKLPIVEFGIRDCDGYGNITQIGIDDAVIGQAAADLLVRRGYKDFAFVGVADSRMKNELRLKLGNDSIYSAKRGRAFEERLAENAYPCRTYVFDMTHPDASVRDLSGFLESLQKPCGVLAYYDEMAYNIYNACRLARLSIPDQIAVIGVDNDVEICEMLRPTLTSILPDFELSGYMAMETLLEKIGRPGRRVPNRLVGIRKIFERESTQDVDGSVRLVTRARAYIAANFDRRLTVSQIAASVKASRRLLEMKFRQVTGGTVHDAVERVRMDEAKRLISCTNRPIGEIAAACGFGSDISFRFAFRRVYGVPPTFYRRQPSSPART